MDDLRRKIIYQRAQRHLKQSLDNMDISELKPQRGRCKDRQISDDADKKSRTEDRKREERTTLYAEYRGVPDNWRPISYTEWRQSEMKKKQKEEEYKASTSAKRHHTNGRDVESKKQRQQRKSSHNISNTSNNMEATRNKYSSVEVVHVNNGPKARTTHRDRSPSIEILKEVPPRRMTTHTFTVQKTTIQHHQITTSRRQ